MLNPELQTLRAEHADRKLNPESQGRKRGPHSPICVIIYPLHSCGKPAPADWQIEPRRSRIKPRRLRRLVDL